MYYMSKGELMPEPFHRYWGSHFTIHFTPILFFMVPFYFSVTMGFIIPYFRNQLGLKGSFEYSALKDCKIVKKYINSIPPDAPVASLSALIPHIPKRKNIYMLPEMDKAEYIVIHTGINLWPSKKEEF